MNRLLLAILVFSVAVLGFVWIVPSNEGERGAKSVGLRQPEELTLPVARRSATSAAPIPDPEPAPLLGAPPATAAPAIAAAREELPSAYSEELARAHWLEGRLFFPEGTPLDEEAFVLARGRDFEHGELWRARVGPDGHFRVAFSERTKTGWLALEARYLFLEENPRLKLAELPEAIVLEPVLGGRIAGRLRLPAGVDPAGIGGEVGLQEIRHEENGSASSQIGSIKVTPELAYAFGGLSCEGRYGLSYTGEAFVASMVEISVAAGRTSELELVLGRGVCLAGRVLDPSGAPLQGVSIESSSENPAYWSQANLRTASSDAAGAFRIQALAPGKVQVRAELDGYVPQERDLGRLGEGEECAGIEFVLSRGNALAGRVVWADGSPAEATVVVGSKASWTRSRFQEVERSQKTAPDGKFRLSGLDAGPFRVEARSKKAEEVLVKSELTGRERKKKKHVIWKAVAEGVTAGRSDLLLTLAPGLELSGRVVDDLGAPVTDFEVRAARMVPQPGGWWSRRDHFRRPFRATDGSFTLEGIAEGDWELSVTGPQHGSSAALHVDLPCEETVLLVLPREARVRGRVLDATGAPAARARVRAEGLSQDPAAFLEDEQGMRSDGSGAFELAGLSPGTVKLTAEAQGRAPSEPLLLELVAGETRNDVVLRLRTGATIEGLVLGADGRPDHGRSVSVANWSVGHHSQHMTDEQGRFRASELPQGELEVRAETEQGLRLHERVSVAEGETIQLRLQPPDVRLVRLHGRVSAGGRVLAGAHLSIQRQDCSGLDRASTESDHEGAYELDLPGSGEYRLDLWSSEMGQLSWSTRLVVPESERFAFDIEVPLGRISGRLLDASGQALEGMLVRTEPERHEDGRHGAARALTDEQGRFELSVPAGLHTVKAGGNHPGGRAPNDRNYAEVQITGILVSENGHVRDLELVLVAGGTLRGTVRLAGGTLVGQVSLLDVGPDGRGSWIGWTPDGRIEVEGISPGRHRISARHETLAPRRALDVEVRAGETQAIELELVPGARLNVRVLDASGTPFATELQVMDGSGERWPIETVDVGLHRVGPLPPGEYTLRAREGERSSEQRVALAGGEETPEIVLRFE
jgi:hypothetical protein